MRKLIFMLLPLALFAQNPPDARALLARADASIFTAKTVRLAATQARGFAGLDPLRAVPSNWSLSAADVAGLSFGPASATRSSR